MGKNAETGGNADRLKEIGEAIRNEEGLVIIRNNPKTEDELEQLRQNQKFEVKIPGVAWLAAFIIWALITLVLYLASALLGSAAAYDSSHSDCVYCQSEDEIETDER